MTQEEELRYSSPEDQAFYAKCVEGLPTIGGFSGTGLDADGIAIPYGCGPHSVRCLRQIVKTVKPKRIFEIGFNLGFSAAMWLELAPKALLLTCDISEKEETKQAAAILEERYMERFIYKNRNEVGFQTQLTYVKPDLAFIDGGHLKQDVIEDIGLCLDFKIPFIAFDDVLPEFGEVQDAIDLYGTRLKCIHVNGNIALYKNNTL